MLAERLSGERRKAEGRSLWLRSSFALPESLTLKGYEISRVVVGSVRVRKVWWARFALEPSCVVRTILRVSVEVRGTILGRGVEVESLLARLDSRSVALLRDALLFNATPDSAAFSLH